MNTNQIQIDILFYTDQISDGRACLTTEEMHHAITVLRKKIGDRLALTDGKGTFYEGRLVQITKHEAWLEIEHRQPQKLQPYHLSIAIAPTKSFDRMEWCAEKLTEIGVQNIMPMLCERSERKTWNAERIRKIIISAMKQSKRAYLPVCTMPMKFSDVIQRASPPGTKYLAVLSDESKTLGKHYKPGSDVLILIGPEGDFTVNEISIAINAGFIPLSLGEYRLRTETAAIVAASTILTLNQT